MTTRLWAIALAAAVLAGCGSDDDAAPAPNAGGANAGRSGSGGHPGGGSKAQSTGTGGKANASGGAGAGHSAAGDDEAGGEGGEPSTRTGGESGAGGTPGGGGNAGEAGEKGSGGETGVSGRGGGAATGNEPGNGGAAGEDTGGAGGASPEGLTDGTSRFDLTVTYGIEKIRVTHCKPIGFHTAVQEEYDADHRVATLRCEAEDGADPGVSIEITTYSGAVGGHDASEFGKTCTADYCEGVGNLDVTYFQSGYTEHLTTDVSENPGFAAFATGRFTLDEFTADRIVSGSLDVTLLNYDYFQISIAGTFAADLHDCGAYGSEYTTCT